MRTFEEAYLLIKDVPGWYEWPESRTLFIAALTQLLNQTNPPTFVELGSWSGRSAMLLGLVAEERPGTLVYSVDAWADETLPTDPPLEAKQAEANFLKFRKQLGLEDIVVQQKGKTVEVAKAWPANTAINLLHIDAGHTFEDCYGDLVAWEPFVAPDGHILLHDYNDIMECGVKSAAQTYFSERPYKLESEVEGYLGSWRQLR